MITDICYTKWDVNHWDISSFGFKMTSLIIKKHMWF